MIKNCLVLAMLMFCLAFLYAQADPAGETTEGTADSDAEYVENLYQPAPKDSSKLMFTAADQALFVMPTAYTMPKGSSALTDFELLILQYTYAPTGNLHLSAGMVFPVVLDMFRTITLGAKFNYLRKDYIQCAFYGSFTPDPELRIANIGHVLSIGDPRGSVHIAVNKPFGSYEDILEGGIIASLGGIVDFSQRVAGIGELYLYTSARQPAQVFALGLRFKGKNISWDLGGFRPFGIDAGEFLAVPFIKATFIF